MKDSFKFKLTNITANGALLSATVTDAECNKFEIAVGFCDGNIKRNTSGRWDSIVYQAAGILHEMYTKVMADDTKMKKELIVTEAVLRQWQIRDVNFKQQKSERSETY